ncbi:hypothetical protein [Hugenholtzia roseola]|uniref:hypothetical protein n=1 Tax=Hugenholtzia roseola TaxID=1002 RepID=UPI0006864795|nr:hypothetical protein [Hugenholtzia roseola]
MKTSIFSTFFHTFSIAIFFAFYFGAFSFSAVQAQGCSDAGFCTMGAMRPNQAYQKKDKIELRSLEISQYYGRTVFKGNIWATNVEANFSLGKKFLWQFKLPYEIHSGRLGTTQGFGDLSLSLTYLALQKEAYQIQLTAGTKIPTNRASLSNEQGLPLPMYYQTSLGTYDLVLGAALQTKKWLLATGFQMPILNQNENAFFWGAWRDSPLKPISDLYPPALHLRRGKDLMLRLERSVRFSRFNAYIGALAIYRFSQDQRFTPNTEDYGLVEGSRGLVCNFLSGVGYRFSTRYSLSGLFAYAPKVLQRETNPDGLGRRFVVSMAFKRNF